MTENNKALRGADIVALSLERLGCQHVFTLSGNHIMSIFDAAIEAKLDLVHVRHEAAAVHMADAWGRLTGQAGIAMVTGGPGHANAVGALYTALGAESPMVLLSGHAATWELGRGGFQEIRQADMAAPVSKASWTATSAANSRPRRRRGDTHRDIRTAGAGAPQPAVRSAGGTRREQCDRLAERAWRIDARAAGTGRRRGAGGNCRCGTADHLRGTAALQRERARTAGKAGGRDRGAGGDPGEPARHRGCDARRLPGFRRAAPT